MAIATIAGIAVAGSPGIAALAGLWFTNQSLQATQQGQITDRYNAAITNLGSANIEVRLGGIYALQRLMQDSPRDQPTVVAGLTIGARFRSESNCPRRAARAGSQVWGTPHDDRFSCGYCALNAWAHLISNNPRVRFAPID